MTTPQATPTVAPATHGYRAYIANEDFGYIGFYRWALVLFQTNKRGAKCVRCMEKIEAGRGVYHEQYGHRGYVHLDCAKAMILKYGQEFGYTVSILSNLQACSYNHGKFTAQEVVESIRVSDRERIL